MIRIHTAWVEYSIASKRRGVYLQMVAKAFNRVLRDATAVRTPLGPSPRLNPDQFFELSVPVYSILSYAWVPTSTDYISNIGALDHMEPWRAWWLTLPSEHPYRAPVFVHVTKSVRSL